MGLAEVDWLGSWRGADSGGRGGRLGWIRARRWDLPNGIDQGLIRLLQPVLLLLAKLMVFLGLDESAELTSDVGQGQTPLLGGQGQDGVNWARGVE